MTIVQRELNKMAIVCDEFAVLQDKDGVTVARIASAGNSYVLKCFKRDDYRRELENYHLLESLDIPTIKVIATSDSAILLEDIACSPLYRLADHGDMSDPGVARRIAVWYKQLHSQGYDYIRNYSGSMYDEADYFTLESIVCIKEKTRTQDAAAWTLLEHNFDTISTMLRKVRRTLTYNDFYYTNMVVARNRSSALMFDYNLLGKGYAYTDLRNVTSSLSAEAGEAFLDEYGGFDPVEKALDDVVSVVVTLYLACQRAEFPNWANRLLAEINTTLSRKIEHLISSTILL